MAGPDAAGIAHRAGAFPSLASGRARGSEKAGDVVEVSAGVAATTA